MPQTGSILPSLLAEMVLPLLLLVILVSGHSAGLTYVVTLNKTDSATVFCFSDFLHEVKIVTPRCAACQARVKDWPTCGKSAAHNPRLSRAECSCEKDCGVLRGEECPFKAGENTACVSGVKAGVSGTILECVGVLSGGGNLTVPIQVVPYNGSEICYGVKSGVPLNEADMLTSGMKMKDSFNETYYTTETRTNLQIVTYDSPVTCINSSRVNMLTAGHLLAAGYMLDKRLLHGHLHKRTVTGQDQTYLFDKFCVLDRPRLWKIKEGFRKGTKYQCNGTLHVLNDEFPCMRFPPVSESFRLPSLENCGTGHMVGIVLAMIIATVVCYIIVIGVLKMLGCVCKIARTEKEPLPLATADSSTDTRVTLTGAAAARPSARNRGYTAVGQPQGRNVKNTSQDTSSENQASRVPSGLNHAVKKVQNTELNHIVQNNDPDYTVNRVQPTTNDATETRTYVQPNQLGRSVSQPSTTPNHIGRQSDSRSSGGGPVRSQYYSPLNQITRYQHMHGTVNIPPDYMAEYTPLCNDTLLYQPAPSYRAPIPPGKPPPGGTSLLLSGGGTNMGESVQSPVHHIMDQGGDKSLQTIAEESPDFKRSHV